MLSVSKQNVSELEDVSSVLLMSLRLEFNLGESLEDYDKADSSTVACLLSGPIILH